MHKNNVRMICEGSLFCAIYAVFMLICRVSTGLIESLLFFIMPLPTIIFSIRYNIKNSLLFVSSAIIICFLLSPLSTIFYLIPAGLVGIFYVYFKKKRVNEIVQIVIMILSSFLVNLLTMFIFAKLFNYNIYDDFGTTINAVLKLFDYIFKSNLASTKVVFYIDLLTPSILIMLSLIEGYLMHMVSSLTLEKLKYYQRRNLPFFLVQLPIYLGIISFLFVIIGFLILAFIHDYSNRFYSISRFILAISILGYILLFIQGIGRIACIVLHKNKGKRFPIVLLLALLLNILVIIFGFYAIFNDKRDDLLYNVKWKGDA